MSVRRVTPAATLLMRANAPREQWLAARRLGLGGSDLPAILGLTPRWRTPAHVWHEKLGNLDGEDSEAGRWGRIHEDAIAHVWAADARLRVRRVGLVRNVDHDWRMATLDRLVSGCWARCALEVKTRSAWKAGEWSGDVPDDVLAQVQWQLMVTGLDHIHVACLIGGNDLRRHVIYPDLAIQSFLAREAAAFWQLVLERIPPPAEPGQALADLYDRLHPDRAGDIEIDPDDAARWISAYDEAADMERAVKTAKAAARSMLVKLLDDGDRALLDGVLAWTYRPHLRDSVDIEALRRDHPEYITKKLTAPVLRRVHQNIEGDHHDDRDEAQPASARPGG